MFPMYFTLVAHPNPCRMTDSLSSSWVRGHAQDYILEYFRQLADKRKTAHSEHLDRINSQAYYQYNMRPHPQTIQDAEDNLKRGIDEDWKNSVSRYPEVLSYFFNLVELSIPSDDDPQVREPALPGPNGHRKAPRRSHGSHGAPNAPQAIAHTSYASMIGGMPPKTPPPMDRNERRGQGHREKRSARHSMPAQHAPYQPYSHAPYM